MSDDDDEQLAALDAALEGLAEQVENEELADRMASLAVRIYARRSMLIGWANDMRAVGVELVPESDRKVAEHLAQSIADSDREVTHLLLQVGTPACTRLAELIAQQSNELEELIR